ncbi:MAG: hypothetical protein JW991_05115 [Candidatus Pacebacteria bacterium]|nr:hypothetical protein [Candidatus Paceibacterota bacterium]
MFLSSAKLKLFILLLILAVLIQGLLPHFNWVLAVVLLSALVLPGKEVAWLAFGAGLLASLFSGQTMGWSSLIFLILAGMAFFLKTRLSPDRLGSDFGLSFLVDLVFNLISFHFVSLKRSFFFALILGLICFFFFKKTRRGETLKLAIGRRRL